MRLSDLIKLAANNLKRRKMRTVLTVLGVVIGTASIVVMVSLGIGMSEMMLKSYQDMGSLTMITVYQGGYGDSGSTDPSLMLTDDTVESFRHIAHVTAVSPSIEVSVEAKCRGYNGSFSIVGVTQDYLKQLKLREGGQLPSSNAEQPALIYGNQILYNSFYKQKSYESVEVDPEKDTMFISFPPSSVSQGSTASDGDSTTAARPQKKYILPVAGILEGGAEDWSAGSYNVYTDIDSLKRFLKKIYKKALVPNPKTNKNGKPYPYYIYDNVYVFVDDMDNVSTVQKQLSDLGFNVSSSMEWLKQAQQQLGMVQLVLGGIGGVSLLVAAIGIMNTMMMSIYERTKEIGVMKVLGCAMPDIRNMFLCESGMIGLMGGTVGLAFSYLISYIINFFTKNAGSMMFGSSAGSSLSSIPLWLAGFAIVFAIGVGMLAGYVPAARAMKLSPLAAIRNE
ncbi:MAG TPA: ABC transporter permease [Oribacterium sp.]|nr:ABC transporter permease [Oribacterium sp.]